MVSISSRGCSSARAKYVRSGGIRHDRRESERGQKAAVSVWTAEKWVFLSISASKRVAGSEGWG